MTIASAFNDIAVAQGGTAAKSGAITAAIDALNDALAGSDQPQAKTIEQAVRLLGEHIGGGSSVTVESLTATENKTYTAPEGKAYSPVTVNVSGGAIDVGDLVFPIISVSTVPQIGEQVYPNDDMSTGVIGINDTQICISTTSSGVNYIAEGSTFWALINDTPLSVSFYDVTIGSDDNAYLTVSALNDVDYTITTVTIPNEEPCPCIKYVMPQVTESHDIVAYISYE